jgi:hypothetical protein
LEVTGCARLDRIKEAVVRGKLQRRIYRAGFSMRLFEGAEHIVGRILKSRAAMNLFALLQIPRGRFVFRQRLRAIDNRKKRCRTGQFYRAGPPRICANKRAKLILHKLRKLAANPTGRRVIVPPIMVTFGPAFAVRGFCARAQKTFDPH